MPDVIGNAPKPAAYDGLPRLQPDYFYSAMTLGPTFFAYEIVFAAISISHVALLGAGAELVPHTVPQTSIRMNARMAWELANNILANLEKLTPEQRKALDLPSDLRNMPTPRP